MFKSVCLHDQFGCHVSAGLSKWVVNIYLVLLAVEAHGLGVGEQQVVPRDVGLRAGVTGGARLGNVRGAPAGGLGAGAVRAGAEDHGLVERVPGLDPVAELPEANVGVVHEVLPACTAGSLKKS